MIKNDSKFRLFPQTNSLFGIMPGDHSIINRLYNDKKLASPIMSIAFSNYQMTLGGLDQNNCNSIWRNYSVAMKNRWIFNVKSVNVANISRTENQRVFFDLINRK
jgi:predicted peptidase